MYTPQFGIWLQRDPAEADPNPYEYVKGDPPNMVDPSGLTPEPDWDFTVGDPGERSSWDPAEAYARMIEAGRRSAYHWNNKEALLAGRWTTNSKRYEDQLAANRYWYGIEQAWKRVYQETQTPRTYMDDHGNTQIVPPGTTLTGVLDKQVREHVPNVRPYVFPGVIHDLRDALYYYNHREGGTVAAGVGLYESLRRAATYANRVAGDKSVLAGWIANHLRESADPCKSSGTFRNTPGAYIGELYDDSLTIGSYSLDVIYKSAWTATPWQAGKRTVSASVNVTLQKKYLFTFDPNQSSGNALWKFCEKTIPGWMAGAGKDFYIELELQEAYNISVEQRKEDYDNAHRMPGAQQLIDDYYSHSGTAIT